MTELQRKSYILWFSWLGDKLLEWSDAKPTNKDIRNCIKSTREIGFYVNQLETENQIYIKRISLLRSDKNNAVERARKAEEQIEILEQEINKLKQISKL
jgi:hypothetical protein